ncbi:MAG: DUF429 domain-containing protein [Planctomycetaceae bacterium]|jgi:hypothetical protein
MTADKPNNAIEGALRAIQDNEGPIAIGLDAAADEKNWGVCVLVLDAQLESAQMPLLLPKPWINQNGETSSTRINRPNRQTLHDLLQEITKKNRQASVGVDVPFGWPVQHHDFVHHWHAVNGWPQKEQMPQRTDFERRLCDIKLNDKYDDIRPLAVGGDTIAQAAFCWAKVRQELAESKFDFKVDVGLEREGKHVVFFESYPGAFVKLNFNAQADYKNKPDVREALRKELRQRYEICIGETQKGWLDWACKQNGSPNAFDAFICALTAWDHLRYRNNPGAVSLTTPLFLLGNEPTDAQQEIIRSEGWILIRGRINRDNGHEK